MSRSRPESASRLYDKESFKSTTQSPFIRERAKPTIPSPTKSPSRHSSDGPFTSKSGTYTKDSYYNSTSPTTATNASRLSATTTTATRPQSPLSTSPNSTYAKDAYLNSTSPTTATNASRLSATTTTRPQSPTTTTSTYGKDTYLNTTSPSTATNASRLSATTTTRPQSPTTTTSTYGKDPYYNSTSPTTATNTSRLSNTATATTSTYGKDPYYNSTSPTTATNTSRLSNTATATTSTYGKDPHRNMNSLSSTTAAQSTRSESPAMPRSPSTSTKGSAASSLSVASDDHTGKTSTTSGVSTAFENQRHIGHEPHDLDGKSSAKAKEAFIELYKLEFVGGKEGEKEFIQIQNLLFQVILLGRTPLEHDNVRVEIALIEKYVAKMRETFFGLQPNADATEMLDFIISNLDSLVRGVHMVQYLEDSFLGLDGVEFALYWLDKRKNTGYALSAIITLHQRPFLVFIPSDVFIISISEKKRELMMGKDAPSSNLSVIPQLGIHRYDSIDSALIHASKVFHIDKERDCRMSIQFLKSHSLPIDLFRI
eukprot:TRINITY_DN2211_c0_g1_i11.p1 TRINITY_DN2211_c0_g1~~TRINITY_DN2211_c0_g1_i11.p1  ORF type:complete len:541 (+),score=120.52 TRINITY_DN2211_c0_g1_i11:47-1669(+)